MTHAKRLLAMADVDRPMRPITDDDAAALTAGAEALELLALADGAEPFALSLSAPTYELAVHVFTPDETTDDARRALAARLIATALKLLADVSAPSATT